MWFRFDEPNGTVLHLNESRPFLFPSLLIFFFKKMRLYKDEYFICKCYTNLKLFRWNATFFFNKINFLHSSTSLLNVLNICACPPTRNWKTTVYPTQAWKYFELNMSCNNMIWFRPQGTKETGGPGAPPPMDPKALWALLVCQVSHR